MADPKKEKTTFKAYSTNKNIIVIIFYTYKIYIQSNKSQVNRKMCRTKEKTSRGHLFLLIVVNLEKHLYIPSIATAHPTFRGSDDIYRAVYKLYKITDSQNVNTFESIYNKVKHILITAHAIIALHVVVFILKMYNKSPVCAANKIRLLRQDGQINISTYF